MQLHDPSLLRTQAYIGGVWTDADTGATFKVVNPVNGEVVAAVADLGATETRRAIEAASDAMPEWAALTAKQRARSCVGGMTCSSRTRKTSRRS